MIAVINASPLISLALIDQIDLLQKIFTSVYVPGHVYQEVVDEETQRPGANIIRQAVWLKVIPINDEITTGILSYQLDRGEAEVIALGCEMKADLLIIDELKGRKIARHLGLNVSGTLGILLMARELKLIPDIKPCIDQLIAKGIWISEKLYNQVLKMEKEID
jgi:hypothetical protein